MRPALLAIFAGMLPFVVLGATHVDLPAPIDSSTQEPPQLLITEIMYNPPGANTGRQWIEILNNGASSIDLGAKTVRLFAGGANHEIKAVNGNSTMLPPGAVAVIADNPLAFMNDWPDFAGQLLKSSFSLTSSDMVAIIDNGATVASASYTSALGTKDDGNSLQRADANEALVTGAPTPGISPAKIPAPLAAPVKPSAGKSSTTNRGTTKSKKPSRTSETKSHSYGNGTIAPAASAEALAAGALPSFSISYPPFVAAIMSSVWFTCFVALLALSGFSLIVIQRHYP